MPKWVLAIGVVLLLAIAALLIDEFRAGERCQILPSQAECSEEHKTLLREMKDRTPLGKRMMELENRVLKLEARINEPHSERSR